MSSTFSATLCFTLRLRAHSTRWHRHALPRPAPTWRQAIRSLPMVSNATCPACRGCCSVGIAVPICSLCLLFAAGSACLRGVVSASILAADFSNLGAEVHAAMTAGGYRGYCLSCNTGLSCQPPSESLNILHKQGLSGFTLTCSTGHLWTTSPSGHPFSRP